MSRILFLCSGNTCRSPMAAAIAQRVFGQSHTISSAGAETGSGSVAAPNAVRTMLEMDLDMSNHKTIDVADLDLSHFDLIVVFRPSVAESAQFPATIPLVYFDIPDPYGGSLDTYRSAAYLIQRRVRELYVEDAIRRSSTDNAPGSHIAGLLNRAAKEFEKEMKNFVTRRLGLDMHEKVTLGQLAKRIADCGASQNRPVLTELYKTIAEVNSNWIEVKHHDDPFIPDLVRGLAGIRRGFQLLSEAE